jgi:hypothetical protein
MKLVSALATVFAMLVLGAAAQAQPIGLGAGVASVPGPVSVPSSVGNAAEGAVSGTLDDVSAHLPSLPVTADPAPSLLGPRDVPPDNVSAPAYRVFEDLVTAGPDAIVVRGVVVTADAFSASGIDGGVLGVSAGRLGADDGGLVARLVM